ncbi:MAG: glycosyltransferase family 1 protein [Campylobacterota bacterium]|nr:glycosyltransferase family 1 protein [Campylobacterota bacterium]
MRKILNFFKNFLNNNPKIKQYIELYIPSVILKLLAKYSYNTNTDFKSFYTKNNLEIRFNLGPLDDTRGIGRVAREQFEFMLKNLFQKPETDSIKSVIHFYTSIHWCPKLLPPKTIIMIHDVIPMIFPDLFKESNDIWSNKFLNISKQALQIFTISKSSKNDIIKYLGINEKDITIINNGVTKLVPSKYLNIKLPKQYFVYLGSYDVHKNLDIILEALTYNKCLDFHILMIGDNMQSKYKVDKLNLNNRVHYLGKLNDSDTGFIIKNSTALLFPSLYEGFGLPPMEAALLKVPSICSNKPTMNEFLDNVSLFADPHIAEQWANQMSNIFNDSNLNKTLSSLAYERISKFTWHKSCKNLIDNFEKY